MVLPIEKRDGDEAVYFVNLNVKVRLITSNNRAVGHNSVRARIWRARTLETAQSENHQTVRFFCVRSLNGHLQVHKERVRMNIQRIVVAIAMLTAVMVGIGKNLAAIIEPPAVILVIGYLRTLSCV